MPLWSRARHLRLVLFESLELAAASSSGLKLLAGSNWKLVRVSAYEFSVDACSYCAGSTLSSLTAWWARYLVLRIGGTYSCRYLVLLGLAPSTILRNITEIIPTMRQIYPRNSTTSFRRSTMAYNAGVTQA